MLHNPHEFESDLPAGFDGQFDWDYLCGAFMKATGRNIQPMDIDAHVEINGQHLVFETKDEGKGVPFGQRKALMSLWAKGYHMIIFLWGKNEPMECEIHWPKGTKSEIWQGKLTKQRLADICEKWARWANSNPCPFQYEDPRA